ncbi:MAG: glycosyltransferase family 4 protein [Chloroflexi bacterium]|nr:glycosyltransferase family 4 protein [Chloroflexota bacterium]
MTDARRRIVLDGRLADYAPGGIAQYTQHLARAMASQLGTDRLTVLRAARPQAAADYPPCLPTARSLTPPHHRLEQIVLPLEIARLAPSLVHSPDFIPSFHRRWRAVITVHDLAFLRYPEHLMAQSRRYYGQIGRAAREADAIIAVSTATKHDLVELLRVPPERISVVLESANPAFGPVEDAQQLEAARRHLGVTRPFVLFVGSLEPRKNLPLLLEAFRELRREHDLELALVGQRGWLYAPIFQRLAELGLGPYVRHIDGLPAKMLPAVYSAAELLAFPSLYEGFGLPLLEAMACGCPVVASDRAAIPEVVGQAGLLVPADDAAALAAAIRTLLEQPDMRAAYIRRGLERARSFSWEKAAAETLALYRRVAA